MKKLTFERQMQLSLGILLLCFVLATLTKWGVFCNIAWVIYGIIWIIHPTWSKSWDWKDHDKLRLGCRIAGVIAIIVGLITRFGV